MDSNKLEGKIDRYALLVRIASSFSRNSELSQAFSALVTNEDEQYAILHPGVAEGVPQYFSSVLEHFAIYGAEEGRRGFSRSLALMSEVDVACQTIEGRPKALLEWHRANITGQKSPAN
jgi:hypothetical protein